MNSVAALSHLRSLRQRILDDTADLVACESPSEDSHGIAACAELLGELARELLGLTTERHEVGGRPHLIWRGGGPTRVLLLGHLDTIWPAETLARWPFSVRNGRATGPGIVDMKAGVAQLLHALTVLDDLAGIAVLMTSDKEVGSPTSRGLVESEAAGVRAALVLEASAAGALLTGRKGSASYRLSVHGAASRAGSEPDGGVNATIEAAHQALSIAALSDPAAGTAVTPTVFRSGHAAHAVPHLAELSVDVRAVDRGEQRRVDEAMRALRPVADGARLEVTGGITRPPLDAASSQALFAVAARAAHDLGLSPLESATAGGASDGNYTAGIGVPTLDGLGAVGENAHLEGEWASVNAMPERAALLAAVVDAIRNNEPHLS